MPGRTQGFSLIEMLVVMTIMGLIVSVVTLSTGSLSAVFGDGGEGSAERWCDLVLVTLWAWAGRLCAPTSAGLAIGIRAQ